MSDFAVDDRVRLNQAAHERLGPTRVRDREVTGTVNDLDGVRGRLKIKWDGVGPIEQIAPQFLEAAPPAEPEKAE